MPQSWPTAQEVIHIRESMLPTSTVRSRAESQLSPGCMMQQLVSYNNGKYEQLTSCSVQV